MEKTYTMPISTQESIIKNLNRFAKKAEKYGNVFSYKIGDAYSKEVRYLEKTPNGEYECVEKSLVEVYDLTITNDIIRAGEYSVVAKIEHLNNGNFVTSYTEDNRFDLLNIPCNCEHCGTKHRRTYTFMVRKDDGSEKQVGSTCLKDYCGISPEHFAALNALEESIILNDCEHMDNERVKASMVFPIEEALAAAIKAIKKQGYVKSDEPHSNREMVGIMVQFNEITDKELEAGKELAKKISEVDVDSENLKVWERARFLVNVKQLVANGYCKNTHFGYIAYAPIAYEKYEETVNKEKEKEEAKKKVAENSNWIGQVGNRITVAVSEMKLVSSWDTMYGTTYLYKFTDENGNVLVWFASRTIDDCTKLVGTVKEHSERDGVKETIITRCKAVA